MSPTHQDLSNDTTFSQIKSHVPVPLSASRVRDPDPILKFWFAGSGAGSGRKWTGSATLLQIRNTGATTSKVISTLLQIEFAARIAAIRSRSVFYMIRTTPRVSCIMKSLQEQETHISQPSCSKRVDFKTNLQKKRSLRYRCLVIFLKSKMKFKSSSKSNFNFQ